MSKLLEERENGTYYLGDLGAAKAYLRNWYGKSLRAFLRDDGIYIVGEWYSPDDTGPSAWGASANGDPEEAWRHFAGVDFGPVDEWYDESELREALAEYSIKVGQA